MKPDELDRRAISLEQNLHFDGWSAIPASSEEKPGFTERLNVDGHTRELCFYGGQQRTANAIAVGFWMNDQLAKHC
jgi:hypothetical protein